MSVGERHTTPAKLEEKTRCRRQVRGNLRSRDRGSRTRLTNRAVENQWDVGDCGVVVMTERSSGLVRYLALWAVRTVIFLAFLPSSLSFQPLTQQKLNFWCFFLFFLLAHQMFHQKNNRKQKRFGETGSLCSFSPNV